MRIAGLVLAASLAADLWSQWLAGARPEVNAYGAMVYAGGLLQFQIVATVVLVAAFAIMRLATGRLDRERRVVFETLALLWAYAIGQGLLGLLLTHGFPRVAGQ